MSNPTVTIHNVETGEIETREMNEQELQQWTTEKVANDAIKATEAAKELAKEAAQAKLAALGLTTEDLKALGL